VVCQTSPQLFFNSTIPELSNTYSELEISNDSENESTDNIGLPTYTSSPIQINQTQSSSTTKKKQGKKSFESHVSVPNIMLGLQDSMISSTSGFLFFID
jgi:hypothetical protein